MNVFQEVYFSLAAKVRDSRIANAPETRRSAINPPPEHTSCSPRAITQEVRR